ncbi:MAG: hypothetical protein IPI49_11905 [Myxococcales bacterium]|nr:hypothetical protein [Myxococcales bacterium]HRC57000.1 hypothetical protein [Kofleriaceae bacterium]
MTAPSPGGAPQGAGSCQHLARHEGLCPDCGACDHDVILNGACLACGTTDLDPLAMSPKKLSPSLVPVARLLRR